MRINQIIRLQKYFETDEKYSQEPVLLALEMRTMVTKIKMMLIQHIVMPSYR
jgi:hypothetical protein